MNDFKNSDDYKKIFSFHHSITNRIISRESSKLEFKESFNWNSRDKYAKSIASFANTKGGYIVFGLKDNPRDLIGLRNDNFENMDEAKITEYLNNIFSHEIVFEKFSVVINSKNLGVLRVYQLDTKPVVCVKNDGELKEAEIYYRYNARSQKIRYAELNLLFEAVREKERKSWMEHFEKISKIGSTNAAIMDVVSGEIAGKGGTILIDKKLISKLKFINEGSFREGGRPVLKLIGDVKPVSVVAKSKNSSGVDMRITDDPNAPVVRLEEEEILKKKYSLSYKELIKVLSARYTNFKTNPIFHKLRKEFMKNSNLSRTRFLDPDNVKSSKKDFYSPNIVKKFDRYYIKKKK